jgi:hypothetical protein
LSFYFNCLLTYLQRGLPAAAGGFLRAGSEPAEILDVPTVRRDFEIVLEGGAATRAARGILEKSGEVGEKRRPLGLSLVGRRPLQRTPTRSLLGSFRVLLFVWPLFGGGLRAFLVFVLMLRLRFVSRPPAGRAFGP